MTNDQLMTFPATGNHSFPAAPCSFVTEHMELCEEIHFGLMSAARWRFQMLQLDIGECECDLWKGWITRSTTWQSNGLEKTLKKSCR